MLLNKQKIYNVVSAHFHAREFSRSDLLDLIDKHYPGTDHTWILPSDYLCKDAVKDDPSNAANRNNYSICPRFLERLGRNRYRFVGWDGIDKGALDAPVLRCATDGQSIRTIVANTRPQTGAPIFEPLKGDGTTDQDRLVAALRSLAPSVHKSSDRVREPAVRVIECVLSLNRQYDSVVPRLDRFERAHSEIARVSDLQALIATYSSPTRFVSEALNYHDEARAATLKAVVDWFVTVSGNGDYDQQLSNIHRWATEAQPADYVMLGIRGFGLGGFQYLRMLFGANTTKPDVHIRDYVATSVRHSVSDIQALNLLELAAQKVGIILVDLDTTIWERAARGV